MCGRMTFAGTERFFNINPFIPRTLEISPSLLPADYCQRERVSDVQRIGTEFVWKSPIRFSDKVLRLKVPTVDNIHYCQLPKELGFQERAPAENPTEALSLFTLFMFLS